MSVIAWQLDEVKGLVRKACFDAGRDPDDVTLVAVSKTFPAKDVEKAMEAGQLVFGESRLQEAEPKIALLPGGLEWHFIGRVQRNKVRKILPLFAYVHAVDSFKLAVYMDGVAKDLGMVPKIFLQVNLAGEDSKGGFTEAEIIASMEEISQLTNLEVIGLMMIPPADDDAGKWFRGLRELRDALEEKFPIKLPSLSMGMSGDFAEAISEGATHVRIGSAIFGKRDYKVEGELG
ncbi:MAG: YggS family pyridoxal phosphate-dependent enzyme [Akkermansiaceae bacterium]|jgi:PLP dependent protein|nr:YggS family pyridoxal phosphate-dependent enzyme [Akkermansiaceae bacterium]MDP4647956.1 YggS family pyridoxal phosphate-dependent enzyme [Akkermansiaceae bacterium]MDP4719746.1 YggS family pyridoxal phosphate-dependent enzyme [Akkermansiaceae bacterium]MDP4781301.1 YggS family pyridoxal phosphate-dependent enzyme [Akkermansiaceae bacterium]MDP4846057.1 YggS family pyridoxal phosphate-dependent enzyme [Akkermansiaceae bacterium]